MAQNHSLIKMKDTGSTTVRKAAALSLQRLDNHRKLVATIFPPSDIVGDDRDEVLHCAASQGMLSSVLALLAERYSYDLPDRFGRTPLHWAAEQGRRNVVLALLRAGACVDPRSKREATPIMLAASRGHEEVVKLLLHYRAGKSDRWPLNRYCRGSGLWGRTALHCAAKGGHLGVVELLLDAGFDSGQHDGRLTPAEVSARQSHSTSATITHLLLPSDMGGKLVHDWVSKGMENLATISGLVEGGAFLDWQNGTGETPLNRAAHLHNSTVSRVLLNAGADPNLSDRLGISPLHGAAGNWCIEAAADLLEAGADVDQVSISGHCPLHEAVVSNNVNVVSLLLDAGASTEHRDITHGQTPLSWACEGCLAPIVRVLVKAGADVESRSSAGLTPLHWACRFNDVESVEVLLSAGADPNVVDRAAASDAMEMSSSESGMGVSLPVAIDVIGLGYPVDRREDSRSLLTSGPETLASSQLELVSVRRIESALQGAKRECSWRRRGWLVILADRCVALDMSGVHGQRWVEYRSRPRSLLPDRVRADTNSDTSGSRRLLVGTQNYVKKMSRNADNVMGIVRSGSSQQGQSSGHFGAQKNTGTILFPELVAALLELAAIEVGIFRRVVLYI